VIVIAGEENDGLVEHFFNPIDHHANTLTLREAFDFCVDFDIHPKHLSRLQIEQTYQASHPSDSLEDMNTIGLNYYEYLDFIYLLAQQMYRYQSEHMDSERRLRTLMSYLKITSSNNLFAHLHNAFRDHHLQKYDELTDFKTVALRMSRMCRAKTIHPQTQSV
jgi:hypothetical protein